MTAAAAAASSTPNPEELLQGSGELATDERNLPRFTSIDLACNAHVVVSFAEERHASVSADDNLLALIDTTVEEGVLRVRAVEPFVSMNQVVVQVSVTSLTQVSAAAGGIIDMRNPEGDSLTVRLAGEGGVRAFGEGKIVHLVASVRGKGTIRLGPVTALSAELTVQGMGRIEARVKDRVAAAVIGSGQIRILGNPTQRKTDIKGRGKVTFG